MDFFSSQSDKSLDDALKENSTDPRSASPVNTAQRNFDQRSGNFVMRDANNERIVIGILPDTSYGMVISKAGYNVTDLFT